ncbi:M28 family peptidase [Oceanihabitans sp. 2_MG-2023]|uniref:M28 family peptidase n=1 Tax=Oceanihabitans sp. 2_MG-2023 TaxID=3062661 RepID=UPI0026E475FE|nr:M28 family peptidase [Oceanihabitans sp. 2_MG-2023]MDO6595588.1 M28 family peptidase [Oceanihabitans sp. 2_MG-2023]
MNYRTFASLLLLFISFTNCKSQTETPKVAVEIIAQDWFHADSLLHHVQVLSSDAFQGRRTGTAGAEKAKNYIVNKFQNLQVLPLTESFEQHFNFTRRSKAYKGINVLGLIKGTQKPEEFIVLSAHYDHEGIQGGKIFNGADDDASGISALFAFAEYFQKNPPKHSVILAAVDAEELGLIGSKYFVENSVIPQESIKLNINMDMISRSIKNELFAIGTRYYKHLEPAVKNIASSENLKLLIGHDGSDSLEDWTNASDHASFHKFKIPFIYFGVEDHKDYHKPTDDYENIHPNFYQNAVTTIITVFKTLDSTEL